MSEAAVVFPSSFFSTKKVDEDMEKEYDAAVKSGFNTVLFGYSEWFNSGRIKLSRTFEQKTKAVYRGWMMKPEQYRKFYEELKENNIQLVTSPEQYELVHLFPKVYSSIKDDTAEIMLYGLHEHIDIRKVQNKFSRFIVKDYVKSVKGDKFPRYFDSSTTQEYFDECMELFYMFRGGLLTGGICIKEYMDLKQYNGKTNEFRAVYVNGKCISLERNSGQENGSAEPPAGLIEKYNSIGSCYYTVDYAELADGTWKILETGDGSVSGLCEGQNYEEYYGSLMANLF